MYWNYIELADCTRIAYGDMGDDGTVPIAVERPKDGGFDSARCALPACRWTDVRGFSAGELSFLRDMLKNNAPLILELAEQPRPDRTVA